MTITLTDRPTVKLRPGNGRRLAEGAPWAFADEIAMDRRTRNIQPGALVRLMEGDRGLDPGEAVWRCGRDDPIMAP